MRAETSGLFDPDDWLESSSSQLVQNAAPGDSDDLELDHHRVLIDDNEGLLSRKVAIHSADKAHYSRYYADIVGSGMKRAYRGPLAWVELFAGPGRLYVESQRQYRPGSPVEAVRIPNRFDHYVFSDLDPKCVRSLEERVGSEPGVHVLQGDANDFALLDQIASIVPRNALMILYADPEGLDLKFETIRYFSDLYEHLDLLINLSVSGVIRALRAGQEEKASLVLEHPSPAELINNQSQARWGPSVREYFENKLRSLGYTEFATQQIRSASRNSPLYDLVLASRNKRAVQFFNEAIKRGPDGQLAMDLAM